MEFSNLQSGIATLVVILVVGFVCKKIGILDQKGRQVLSTLTINVALPAMLMDATLNASIDFSENLVLKMLCAVGAFLIITFLLASLIAKDCDNSDVYMTANGNLGFLGFPLVAVFFGKDALFYAVWLSIPIVILSSSFFASRKKERLSWKMLFNPPIIASVVAIALFLGKPPIPPFITDTLNYVGSLAIPGAILVVGASLGNTKI